MEVSELVWRLFVILMPGVLTTLFIRYITRNKSFSPFYFVIYSSVLGIGVFIFLELLFSATNILMAIFSDSYTVEWGLNLKIWDSLSNGGKEIARKELFYSYLTSLPFGLIIGYSVQHKYLNRFLKWTKLTTRFGDGDVYSHFLNMKEVDYVIVRDYRYNLAYFGLLRAYSEPGETREILLENVDVYTSDKWEELYSSEAVFLEFEEGKFSIEKPKKKEDKNNQKETETNAEN